jgi:SAM-dependent methyltransferase
MQTTYTYHNKRAEEIWEQITPQVSFTGKTVIDVGCGYGDFSFLAYMANAGRIDAIDINQKIIEKARIANEQYFGGPGNDVNFYIMNIERGDLKIMNRYDIGICFSVLPYLNDPFFMLRKLSQLCHVLLLEVQYAGDGPGFTWVKNDDDLAYYIGQAGFTSFEPIGRTKVKQDRWERTIWLCQ